MPLSALARERRVMTHRPVDDTRDLRILIHCRLMHRDETAASPLGSMVADAARRRALASPSYRKERARLEPYEAVARQVIRLRAQHGLSQEELASRIGTSHSQISRIESGHYRTSVETLRRVAEAFDSSLVISFEPRAAA